MRVLTASLATLLALATMSGTAAATPLAANAQTVQSAATTGGGYAQYWTDKPMNQVQVHMDFRATDFFDNGQRFDFLAEKRSSYMFLGFFQTYRSETIQPVVWDGHLKIDGELLAWQSNTATGQVKVRGTFRLHEWVDGAGWCQTGTETRTYTLEGSPDWNSGTTTSRQVIVNKNNGNQNGLTTDRGVVDLTITNRDTASNI